MNKMETACFDCGAEPGERCITRTGRPARRPHDFRGNDQAVSWRAVEIAASIHRLVDIDFISADANRVAEHLVGIADSSQPTDQERGLVFRLARLDNLTRPKLGYTLPADFMDHVRRFADEVDSVGAAL